MNLDLKLSTVYCEPRQCLITARRGSVTSDRPKSQEGFKYQDDIHPNPAPCSHQRGAHIGVRNLKLVMPPTNVSHGQFIARESSPLEPSPVHLQNQIRGERRGAPSLSAAEACQRATRAYVAPSSRIGQRLKTNEPRGVFG